LKRKLHVLTAERHDLFLELGECLERLHVAMPTPQFMQLVKSRGLGRRKTYYLIETARKLRPHMRYRARLKKLGWTKCQLIAAQLPQADFGELLEIAEDGSVQDLKAYGRRSTITQHRCVLLYFTPEQYRQYERALLKFGATRQGRGLANKEAATLRM